MAASSWYCCWILQHSEPRYGESVSYIQGCSRSGKGGLEGYMAEISWENQS